MGKISILAFLTCACSPRVGWTAWPIWRNLENTFKERYQKVGKCAKNVILQENSGKLGKRSRMYFAVFDGFRTIRMIFIDQNMAFHDFSVPGDNSR